MFIDIPNINTAAICITDNPRQAAVISSYFYHPDKYFSVFEGIRFSRQDWVNELSTLYNIIRSIKPNRIILASFSEKVIRLFKRNMGEEFEILIVNDKNIETVLNQ